MRVAMISRRDFLSLSLLPGLWSLAGCAREFSAPTLTAAQGTLPKDWINILPKPWRFRPFRKKEGIDPYLSLFASNTDLLAIGDGWISSVPNELIQPISAPLLFERLDEKAKAFLKTFDGDLQKKLFPIGISPWVMLFRNGTPWLKEAREGWDVLLDPDLRGGVVLPESPRLIMSLAERIDGTNALFNLRSQALAFDDRNGINWLLSGEARVAVVPLYSCFTKLISDQRLTIVLPNSGAPLNWTFLVRPSASKNPLPQFWLKEAWQMPLLGKLLSRGWIPPLPLEELRDSSTMIPNYLQSILLPSQDIWNQCWSLPPLNASEKITLEKLWIKSDPRIISS